MTAVQKNPNFTIDPESTIVVLGYINHPQKSPLNFLRGVFYSVVRRFTPEQSKRMSLYQRLRYSLYLAAVGGALLGLIIAVASADVVGLLPKSAFDFLMSPGYLLVVFVVAFFAAPIVAPHFPLAWEATTPDQENKSKNSYAIRLIMLAGVGLLLAVLGDLLVYLLR